MLGSDELLDEKPKQALPNVAHVLLRGRVLKLLSNYEDGDLSLLSRTGDPTQFKKNGSYSKGGKKGGKPPIDYSAIEMKVDLEMELKKPEEDCDYEFLLAQYLRLARLMKY